MKTDQPRTIFLKDYVAPDYGVEDVKLVFDLESEATRVVCSATYYAQFEQTEEDRALVLDGEDLKLLNVVLDGVTLKEGDYRLQDQQLILNPGKERFELIIETEIDPKGNTQLSGLYQSNGTYCTQCEAQGFRRITYFQDRPDVMAKFEVTIMADPEACPVMLSNGNLIESGQGEDGRHFVVWQDPFPKPTYLFALVAGDLAVVKDHFKTQSGRPVDLHIYVEHGNEDRVDYAMDSLKRSMKWDEERFGLEYDLDLYNIVAVSDFNMGAMENKSLNVFNTKYVLAKSETATDTDYAGIEAVIAHEYFHNWTGNRVTCRDWFQLSLKEGLTVFRDQEFSSDMRARSVERISAVKILRAAQFPEDGGPLAHPVRPESYMAIDNFYTATVYNKGAEVIRMMHTLLGEENFRKGMDLYFERHDGQAVTCDDFANAMADASQIDLSQFKLWYAQAGTPEVTASWAYKEADQTFELTLEQSVPDTPGQSDKKSMHIPIDMALINAQTGAEIPGTAQVLSLREKAQTFTFDTLLTRPIVSLNRGFSAPIKLSAPYTSEDLVRLMGSDPDDFARWEAAQTYGAGLLLDMIADIQASKTPKEDRAYVTALSKTLNNAQLDKAFVALCLQVPMAGYLAEQMDVVDVDALFAARKQLRYQIAETLMDDLMEAYHRHQSSETYQPNAAQAGQRALKNVALGYLAEIDDPACLTLIINQYKQADNMTDRMAALSILSHMDVDFRLEALDDFYARFKEDPLVVDKWLAVQALSELPGTLDHVKALMSHEAFSLKNPNKVRSLIGAFVSANILNYHNKEGSGYRFHCDQILALDAINPQIASRMTAPLGKWRRFNEHHQALMKEQLQRIVAHPDLSKDTFEMASKSLGT